MKRNLFCLLFCLIQSNLFAQIFFEKTYPDTAYSKGYGVQQMPDSGYMILATTQVFTVDTVFLDSIFINKLFLIRTNSNGDTLWTKLLNDTSFNYLTGYEALDLQKTSDGNLIALGGIGCCSGGVLVKFDYFGNIYWATAFSGPDINTLIFGMKEYFDKGFLVTGSNGHLSNPNYYWDVYLVKIDSLGVIEFDTTYGKPEVMREEILNSI